MTTATMFSRQNDAGSRGRTSFYWENLVLVVVLVLEVSNGKQVESTLDVGLIILFH